MTFFNSFAICSSLLPIFENYKITKNHYKIFVQLIKKKIFNLYNSYKEYLNFSVNIKKNYKKYASSFLYIETVTNFLFVYQSWEILIIKNNLQKYEKNFKHFIMNISRHDDCDKLKRSTKIKFVSTHLVTISTPTWLLY